MRVPDKWKKKGGAVIQNEKTNGEKHPDLQVNNLIQMGGVRGGFLQEVAPYMIHVGPEE